MVLGTKAKHKNMLIKKTICINIYINIFINGQTKIQFTKLNNFYIYILFLYFTFKIVFQVFPQVIKLWKTVKFHPNLICLLINEM